MTRTATTDPVPAPRDGRDPVGLIALAVLAPSVHNSQPWLFRVRRDGDADVVELWADQSRRLPVLDPTGRLLHVSCGAALHHLELAARAAGLDPVVRLLPDPGHPGHLATVRLRSGGAPTPTTLRLVAAAPLRHSQRDPFLRRDVGAPAKAHLRAAALACTAWLQVVEDRGDLAVLALLNGIADGRERDDDAYRAEIAAWRRTDPDAVDGITDAALPTAGVTHRHSDVDLRDFDLDRTVDDGPVDEAAPVERPLIAVLCTDRDDAEQWLHAGRALARVLLTGTTLGLQASLLGQVVDAPGTRLALRRELRLLGFPQMVLRIGYGAATAGTPRRPLADVVEVC